MITIGLPFFNARDSLADAIRSVFAQTFEDWELLLVDDGSTDGSLEVAHSVRDSRVRVLSDGANKRLPYRLNQIADVARGELIARLDADDMMHPERLDQQLRMFRLQPLLDMVGTAYFAMNRDGDVIHVGADSPVRTGPLHVLRKGFLSHATLLLRRAWIRANRYDERYPRAEDHELFCRTCAGVRFSHIDTPLYFVWYRKSPDESLRDYVASCRDNRRLFMRHAPRMLGPGAASALAAESLAKELVFRAFSLAGHQEFLVRRRGRRATATELLASAAALARIRGTRVAGVDAI